MFDKLIINHSAPTLAGIKLANIFTCDYNNKNDLYKRIVYYNKILNNRGINLDVIKFYHNKALIYVYNREQLKKYFLDKEVMDFLSSYGYKTSNIYKNISLLKMKMRSSTSFPHEIAIFLGYPLKDILGYINNCGKNCLYSGYWKVYHNKEGALNTFDCYNRCREFYVNSFLRGNNILEIMDVYNLLSNSIN